MTALYAGPAAAGGVGFPHFNNPLDMTPIAKGYSRIAIRDGGSNRLPNSWHFWDCWDAYGDKATLTTDTYATLVDVSNTRGIMSHIHWPLQAANNTDSLYSARITVDGTEYVKTFQWSLGSTIHCVLGVLTADDQPRTALFGTFIDAQLFRASSGLHSPDNKILEHGSVNAYYVHPFEMIARGFPVLHFTDSLKVEVKMQHAVTATGYSNYAGVMWAEL